MPVTTPTPRRTDRRDPRLALPELVDIAVARGLWESLPPDCRRDHFDKTNMPQRYRAAVAEESAGGDWTTQALSMRSLPEVMTWEAAWLIHREIELGRQIRPVQFNAATRVLRTAITAGGSAARAARSLLDLTAQEWVRHARRGPIHRRFAGSVERGARAPRHQAVARHGPPSSMSTRTASGGG